MAVFTEPTKWAQTLGKDADVTTIPNTAGETDPSIDKIFPAVFSIPLARGGRAIPRSVLNGLFKLLGDWVYYIQNGGIASYSNTFDYAVGSFVKYNNNFYRCIQANGVSSTVVAPDSNTEYWQRLDGAIGEIKYFAFNTPPDGYLVCNGANVSRTTYAGLFNAIGTAFGSGDGSTTFTLPNLIDKFAQGSTTVGTVKSAGLPNITGHIGTDVPGKGNVKMIGDGAFTPDTASEAYSILFENTNVAEQKEPFYTEYSFNASRSNAIYGNSTTVQPPALALLPCIKY